MSTYSDVRIITTKKGFTQMYDIIKDELEKTENKEFSNALDNLNVKYFTPNFVLFGWDYINYDSNFSDYKFVKDALNKLEELDISYSISVKCESMQEVHEYKFESEKNNYIYIPIPSIMYSFDDKETINELLDSEKDLEEMECDM